jgi:hypothetical protein
MCLKSICDLRPDISGLVVGADNVGDTPDRRPLGYPGRPPETNEQMQDERIDQVRICIDHTGWYECEADRRHIVIIPGKGAIILFAISGEANPAI